MGWRVQARMLIWKNVYLYRTRRVWLLSLVEAAVALLVISGIWNDALEPSSKEPTPPKVLFAPEHPLSNYRSENGPAVLFYAPTIPFYRNLSYSVAAALNITRVKSVLGNAEVEARFQYRKAGPGRLLALLFRSDDSTGHRAGTTETPPSRLHYTVRISGLVFDLNLDYLQNLVLPGPLNLTLFPEATHLLPVQFAVERSYLNLVAEARGQSFNRSVVLQRFPYPSVYPQNYNTTFARTVIRFGVAFLLPFSMLVVQLTEEKASGMRELQRISGVYDAVYWGSHFLSAQSFLLPLEAVMELLLYRVANRHGHTFLLMTNPLLVYVILVFYGSAAIMHAFFLSVFVNTYRGAAIVSLLYWVLSILVPYMLIQNPYGFGYYLISRPKKLLSSLVPGMCLHWCWTVIERFERFGGGANWSNFYDIAATPDNVTLLELLLVHLASCVLLGFFVWYLDNVLSWCYGVHQPPWFPFTRSYWCPPTVHLDELKKATWTPSKIVQKEPKDVSPILYLMRLSKMVGGEPVLDKVNLKVFNKQITVLLANPAGASSAVLQIVTGFLAPDNGRAILDRYDIQQNPRTTRRHLSYCPGSNILFGDLTVEEHLLFFAVLSGIQKENVRMEVAHVMSDLQLYNIRSVFRSNLDNGQQRLLSVAIAVICSNTVKLLVLDNPTAHMHPLSRRDVWELLLKLRRYRGVLLATEDLEEADALGDRILFLQDGRVRCAGSPAFLRGRFGMGYQVRFQKGSAFDEHLLDNVLQRNAPGIQRKSDTVTEVTYQLAGHEDASVAMRNLFLELERQQHEIDIASVNVTVNTLEDLLCRIRDRIGIKALEETLRDPPTSSSGQDIIDNWTKCKKPNTLGRVRCVLYKRYLDWKRAPAPLRWALPATVFFIWSYCEYIILRQQASVHKTLDYNVRDVLGSSEGFCEVVGTDGPLDVFADQMLCPVLWESGLRAVDVDATRTTDSLLDIARDDMRRYVFQLQMGTVVQDGEFPRVILWYNGQSPHNALLVLNLYHTAVLRKLTGNPAASVVFTNAPTSLASPEPVQSLVGFFREYELGRAHRSTGYVVHAVVVRVLGALFVPMAVCTHAASFVFFVLAERCSRAKHLQLMTGLSGTVYWTTNLCFDLSLCFLHGVLFTTAIRVFRDYLDTIYIVAVFAVFVAYSVSAVPLAYLASFFYDNATSAFHTLASLYFFGGVVGAVVATAADLIGPEDSAVGEVAAALLSSVPLRWLPSYSLSRALIKLILLRKENLLCMQGGEVLERVCRSKEMFHFANSLQECCADKANGRPPRQIPPLSLPMGPSIHTGYYEFLTMLLQGCVYLAVVIFLDSSLLYRFWWLLHHPVVPTPGGPRSRKASIRRVGELALRASLDADVFEESRIAEALVQVHHIKGKALVAYHLKKTFGYCHSHTAAVDGISFTLDHKECLGLFGVSGTGKSTLLRMLAGDLFVTSGEAHMGGLELTRHARRWQRNVGYCPAEGGLIETLTGRELLTLYASLHGVPDVPRAVASVVAFVKLPEPDALVELYAPGARGKLALAISLQGSPTLLLLDMPELDIVSRTHVRQVIQAVRDAKRLSILLTCNRLDRFDVVCDRIAILVAGRMECIGSAKHLREKHGRFLTISVHTFPDRKQDLDHLERIAYNVLELFPDGCSLVRCHNGLLEFRLATEGVGKSEVFDKMLMLKKRRKFHEFYVSDTTLEQIFASLAHKQAGLQS